MFRAVSLQVKRQTVVPRRPTDGRAAAMSDNGGAGRQGSLSRGWVSLVAYARRGVAATQNGEGGVQWRVLLLGISALGTVAAIFCVLTGHWVLAGRLFVATLLVLGVLLFQAVM